MIATPALQPWSVENKVSNTKRDLISRPLAPPMIVKDYYLRVADRIKELHQRGYTSNFILLGNRVFCMQTGQFLTGNEFDITEAYSFENDRSGREQTVIYTVEYSAHAIKGILFQNFGDYQKPDIIMNKLKKFWR